MALDYSVVEKIFTPEERTALRTKSMAKGLWVVIHCWAMIIGIFALFAFFPNPLTFLLCVVMMAGRQLGLAIIMHDAAHGLLVPNIKVNDFLGIWLGGQPILSDLRPYRPYHLAHHRNVGQKEDPDLGLSEAYPLTKDSFRRKVIRDLTGQTGWKQRRNQFRSAFGPKDAPFFTRLKNFFIKMREPLITNGIILGGCIAVGHWYLYPLLWVLPLLTVYQLISRVRNMAEHGYVPDQNDILRNARTVRVNWLERILFAPYAVNYHVEHHLMMSVPCYNLPYMHKLLMEKGYADKMELLPSYRAVLSKCVFDPPQTPVAA